MQAIAHLKRIDDRLLALLWCLAERWGRVSPDGVVVALRLPHRTLGSLVGARRPSVPTALGQLMARGEVERRPDGGWLLLGNPPEPRSQTGEEEDETKGGERVQGKVQDRESGGEVQTGTSRTMGDGGYLYLHHAAVDGR